MKLLFKPNINSDMWNWGCVLNSKGSYGQDWLEYFPKDISQKNAKDRKKLRTYLNKKYYKSGAIKKYCDWLQAAVDPKTMEGTLLRVTGRRIPFKTVCVTPTTYSRCPYDYEKGSFFIFYGAGPRWIYQTGTHECMHFIVHKYYWKQMLDAGLTSTQAHDIKEALTVLLNDEFMKYGEKAERGYPNHQNLRKDIMLVSKTKKFDEIVKKSIEIYLKRYMKRVS